METSESHSHERGSTALAVTFEDEVATGNEVTVDPLVTAQDMVPEVSWCCWLRNTLSWSWSVR